MNGCKDCIRRNDLCIGFMDDDIVNYLDTYLRHCKPYPAKIILGADIFGCIINEMEQHGVYGLKVNPAGEYKKLFGMDIVIDKYCRNRIAFEGVMDFKKKTYSVYGQGKLNL